MQKVLILNHRNDPLVLTWANKAVRMNEFSDEALYTLGLVLQNQQKYADAMSYYERVIKVNPNHIFAHYNLAVIQSLFENFEESIDWCEKTLDLNSEFANAMALKGYCYEMQGNKKAALQEYKAALSINPGLDLAKIGLKNVQ
jgi:tetratricopeptide (TPR) repeat protein